MRTAKEEVKALLDKLPDNCSLEDIQYHLYIVEKIHRGIEEHRQIPHDRPNGPEDRG